jgi:hypothetical protein
MPFTLAVDFDHTLFDDETPRREVINKVKEFKEHGAEIALWTCREGTILEDALELCRSVGFEPDSVNENCPSTQEYINRVQEEEGVLMATRKIMADLYVDDKAYNIPFFLKVNVAETCKKYADR